METLGWLSTQCDLVPQRQMFPAPAAQEPLDPSPVCPTVLGARPTARTESSFEASHTEQRFRISWPAVSIQVQPALAIPQWKAVQ